MARSFPARRPTKAASTPSAGNQNDGRTMKLCRAHLTFHYLCTDRRLLLPRPTLTSRTNQCREPVFLCDHMLYASTFGTASAVCRQRNSGKLVPTAPAFASHQHPFATCTAPLRSGGTCNDRSVTSATLHCLRNLSQSPYNAEVGFMWLPAPREVAQREPKTQSQECARPRGNHTSSPRLAQSLSTLG